MQFRNERNVTSTAARRATIALGALLLVPAAVSAQMSDRWMTPDRAYDEAAVAAYVSSLRSDMAERRALGEELFAMNDELVRTPHVLEPRPAGPLVPRLYYPVEAGHLIRYQVQEGGSLGRLHGATDHPVGLRWLPQSMFAQSGRVFGQWGHARLLAAIADFIGESAD